MAGGQGTQDLGDFCGLGRNPPILGLYKKTDADCLVEMKARLERIVCQCFPEENME